MKLSQDYCNDVVRKMIAMIGEWESPEHKRAELDILSKVFHPYHLYMAAFIASAESKLGHLWESVLASIIEKNPRFEILSTIGQTDSKGTDLYVYDKTTKMNLYIHMQMAYDTKCGDGTKAIKEHAATCPNDIIVQLMVVGKRRTKKRKNQLVLVGPAAFEWITESHPHAGDGDSELYSKFEAAIKNTPKALFAVSANLYDQEFDGRKS